MNSTLFKTFCLITSFVLVASCGEKKSSSGELSKNISANEAKFIKIADAPQFLSTWSNENTLVYHIISEPDNLHPTNGLSVLRAEIMSYTQIYLLATDYQTLTVRPSAVKALPEISLNGKEYTYELRTDIKFDDGKSLSVEDVIFTFKANKCPLTNNPAYKSILKNLLDIRVDKSNPNKFTVVMKDKYIQNISFLGDYPILQRTFFDKNNVLNNYTFAQFDDPNFKAETQKALNDWALTFNSSEYGREPQLLRGAGPYRVERWDAGQSITLVKKQHHWTQNSTNIYETSFPDKIIFKLNKDINSQLLEFKSQVLDASTSLSNKTLLELQEDSSFNMNYNSRFTDTYNYGYVAMNMKPDGIKRKKLFTDKRVRRAMALLSPIDDINKIVNKGKNKRVVGPVSILKPSYNHNLKLIPFDIAAAKKILTEAGWKDTDADNILDKIIDGEKVKMQFDLNYFNTSPEWASYAEMLAEQMYKAGVKANLNPLDPSTLMEHASNHDFDMMIGAWGGNVSPEDFTQIWHTSSWISKGSNFVGFGNAATDALIDSIKRTFDTVQSIAMIKRFQEIVYDEQPYVFLLAGLRRNVIHKRFGNQEMYFERPGVCLNNLRLLSNSGGVAVKVATDN